LFFLGKGKKGSRRSVRSKNGKRRENFKREREGGE
jgi:hypothetical protein